MISKKEVLDLDDDAARVNLGGSWRMPTADDFQELLDNCTWNYNENGSYTVLGSNGNSILLPLTEFYYGEKPQLWAGYYRTSSLSDNQWKLSKYFVHWNPEYKLANSVVDGIERGHGMAVRPVCSPTKWYAVGVKPDLEGGNVSADLIKAKEGDLVTLTVTPAEGYELDRLVVKQGETEITVSDDNKFIMPAGDVIVNATFKPKTSTALDNAEAFEIYAENGRIVCDGDFRIYDLLGHDVTRINGSLCGVYIVKVGGVLAKVVCR